MVVVASAGNSGVPGGASDAGQAPESFPADYPGVISVGAVNAAGAVAGFSSDNLSVQLAAPGVSVPAQGRDGQYWWVSGTSPACALVAGVAALIKSKYPDLAPNLVATALTSTTTGRPAGGYDSQVGFGIVDAAAALAKAGELAGDPPAPAGIAAAARFGGGPAAVAQPPVHPRGSGQLFLFVLLALISLVLTAAAATRLVILRRSRPVTASRPPRRAPPPPLDDFASRVLDVVDSIPAGRVMSYGDIAEYLGAGLGPRQVGRVMSVYGGAVAWWRVIHSDGTPAPGHDSRALAALPGRRHAAALGPAARPGRHAPRPLARQILASQGAPSPAAHSQMGDSHDHEGFNTRWSSKPFAIMKRGEQGRPTGWITSPGIEADRGRADESRP